MAAGAPGRGTAVTAVDSPPWDSTDRDRGTAVSTPLPGVLSSGSQRKKEEGEKTAEVSEQDRESSTPSRPGATAAAGQGKNGVVGVDGISRADYVEKVEELWRSQDGTPDSPCRILACGIS